MTQQSTIDVRAPKRPSYAQLDGTEPEFEIRKARRVAVSREQARLIVVAPTRKATGDGHHGQACQDAGTKR